MQITLYFFAKRKLRIKFITMFCQRCFEKNNKIKKLLLLSRDVLFFLTKIAVANVSFDDII